MTKYLSEIVIGVLGVASIAFILAGEYEHAQTSIAGLLGYALAKSQKLNGELAAIVAKKK